MMGRKGFVRWPFTFKRHEQALASWPFKRQSRRELQDRLGMRRPLYRALNINEIILLLGP